MFFRVFLILVALTTSVHAAPSLIGDVVSGGTTGETSGDLIKPISLDPRGGSVDPSTGTIEERAILVSKTGADPWVISDGRRLYYTHTTGSDVRVWVGDSLDSLGHGSSVTVWGPSSHSGPALHNVWAPEIHNLRGRWYVYFSADDGSNHNHRMYVLESLDGPLGPYQFKGRLEIPGDDRWAIDGTVVEFKGELFFSWSGWPGPHNGEQNLYLAKMNSPWSIAHDPVLISKPSLEWEAWINEGPQFLERNGRLFLVYSANLSWSDHYRLGMLELAGDDPMRPSAWKKQVTPVFESVMNVHQPVVAPGHCSFFRDVTGRDWIVYHVARHPGAGWDREVRAQPWSWGDDGFPRFGMPLPLVTPLKNLLGD